MVTVKYRSDGYDTTMCEVVGSSGNAIADKYACMTLPLLNMRTAVIVQAPVWLPATIEGDYRGPIPQTYPARWLTGSDMDQKIYRESQASNAVVRLDIGESGDLTACNLALQSKSQRYNALVLRVFCKRASFHPATLNGKAVASTILIPLRYFNPNR